VTVLAGNTYHTLVPIVWNRNIYLGSIDIGFPKQVVERKARELMMNSAILFCIYLIMAVFASSTLMHIMLRNINRIRQGIETLFQDPTYTLPPVKGNSM
jgi:sensor histidine kinase regulating citrate/malate metabolism